jgi:Tfp pilus assembly protein PilO
VLYFAFSKYPAIQQERESIDSEIASVRQEKESKEKEFKEIQVAMNDLESTKESLKKQVEELEALRRTLPSDNSDVATIEIIQKIVRDINLQNVYLTPEPNEQNMGFYLIRNINFKATGTYLQFLLLMESIGNNERIFNMPKVSLTKSAKAQRGRFQLVDANVLINTYRYNPDYTEDTGIQKIEEEFKAAKKNKKGKNKKKEESVEAQTEE